MNTDSKPVNDNIVARCPKCKRVVFAAANLPSVMDRKKKQQIAEMLMEGYTVEHMTSEQVRASEFGCDCKKSRQTEFVGLNPYSSVCICG